MSETPVVTAFLDASVIYPALLRDILMRLALKGLFRARWSARVQDEWITALSRNRPDLLRARIERARDLMNAHIQDALVEGYEHRIDALSLPDADDRHVLAAAAHCGANMIITVNLRDFPPPALAPFSIEACHPDAFILDLLEKNETHVVEALRLVRQPLKNPPLTVGALLGQMSSQGLAASADALTAFIDAL